jgi:hypothetical protein
MQHSIQCSCLQREDAINLESQSFRSSSTFAIIHYVDSTRSRLESPQGAHQTTLLRGEENTSMFTGGDGALPWVQHYVCHYH